jgi:hypothetical protein
MSRELLEQIGALAQREERTRSKTVEIGMRLYVQSRHQQTGADPLAKHLAPPSPRERVVRGGRVA